MLNNPSRYIIAQRGIGCISDNYTVGFGFIEGYSCATGKGSSKKKQNEYPEASIRSHIHILVLNNLATTSEKSLIRE